MPDLLDGLQPRQCEWGNLPARLAQQAINTELITDKLVGGYADCRLCT